MADGDNNLSHTADESDIDDIEFNFEIDDNTPLDYVYYLIGEKPLRVGYRGGVLAVVAEILNSDTKEFEINNFYLDYVAKSTEVIRINEQEFTDACLKNGVKPPPKK